MIHILIADDHAIVRRGLRQLLAEEVDFDVVADVASTQDAMNFLRQTQSQCDVILLDMTMPQKHGLDLLDDLHYEFPKLRALVLSMHSEDQFGVRALKAGACGYLTKDTNPDEIAIAIRKIAAGGKYITPKLAELLEFHLHHGNTLAPHETLSSREFSVFLMIAKGRTVGEIAEELSLSIKTVSNYRARALEKMNLKSNADIIHYAHRNGLVT
jgi:DNA-binding NarL/FixJ family response regulator